MLGHIISQYGAELEHLQSPPVRRHPDAKLLIVLDLEGIKAGNPDLEASHPL